MTALLRRTLLKAAGIGLALPAPMILSRKAWAPPPPPPLYGVQATHFNGATRLEKQADGSFPTTASVAVVVYSYRTNATGSFTFAIVNAASSPYNTSILGVTHIARDTRGKKIDILFSAGNGLGTGGIFCQSLNGSLPNNALWHQVMLKADLQTGTAQARLDAVAFPQFQISQFTGPCTMPLYQLNGHPVLYDIGAPAGIQSAGTWLIGDLAEFYLYLFDTDVDLNDPNIQAGFRDAATGFPARQSPDGGDALVDISGNAIKPQIYLHGGPSVFADNTPHWVWSWNDATDDPADPRKMAIYGTLGKSADDPWRFAGEA